MENQKILYDYNRLRGYIIEKFGSLKNFSSHVGIPYTHLSSKMNNRNGFKQSEILKSQELLGLSLNEVGALFFTRKVLNSETLSKTN